MFILPESLEGLTTTDAVDALITEAGEEFRSITLDADTSDEDLDRAEALEAALTTLRTHRETVVAADTARADRLARLAAVNTDAPADPEPPAEPEEEEPEVPAEPEVEVVVPDAVIPTQEALPVAASANPSPSRNSSPAQRAAANAPAVTVPRSSATATLIAAADVPGLSNGQELEGLAEATAAILARSRGLPKTNLATAAGGVRQRYGAALIRKEGYGEGLVQVQNQGDDYAMVWRAGNESRLPGGSLVAAGGWCAPSETLYDLCQFETLEGILDIPEINVNRGGIRWTEGPNFDDIYDACGFIQTEAEAIAGDCKDCCMVDCPPFDEIRLDAIGLCVKSPLLTEHAYPELTQRFIEGALIAHQHKVNKYVLDAMLMAAGTPVAANNYGSLHITLSAIELTALGIRYQYRLAQTSQLEVVLPFWLKTLIRMDLAMMTQVDPTAVSDSRVDAWFTSRNLTPNWVYDFQDPVVANCTVTLPGSATILMYPAGTWVKGTTDVINLDSVYDSPNLEANQFTALFVEEGILAVQKCTHTCAITVPICVSGKGVLDDIEACVVGPGNTLVTPTVELGTVVETNPNYPTADGPDSPTS